MTSFSTVVQQEIYQALAANASLVAETVGIFDDVPQPDDSGYYSDFPYVTIGEDVFSDMSTDSELMSLVSITIHTWSRYGGRKEIKRIQGLIYDTLNRATIVNQDYKFININEESAQSQMETDGKTRHGIQTFRLILEEI